MAPDKNHAGDRRAITPETARVVKENTKVKKTNYALIITIIFLASVLMTLAVIVWDINERAKEREAIAATRERDSAINEYLNCLQLFATGVREKSCDKYRDWITRNTNVRGPQ